MTDDEARFGRYIGGLTDTEVLLLHRMVCRRAALIYGPMYAAKREVNYRASRGHMLAAQDARRATPSRD